MARVVAALTASALMASACGGGDDGSEPAAAPAADTVEPAAPAETADTAGPTTETADSGGATGEAPATADIEQGADGADAEQELLVAPVDTTTTTTPTSGGEADADAPAVLEPQYGGTLRVAASAEGDGLSPAANAISTPVYLMAHPVFDPLAYFDTEGNWIPVLAESWTKIGDGTVWQMKLREGVRFHDGTELDADDVVATFEAQLADPLISIAFRPGFDADEPIRKVDEYTVEFVGVRPSAHLPNAFTGQIGMVLPSEWLQRAAADPSLNQMPVGTGPFMVESRIQDEVTVLVRNPDYWAADLIDVYLDRIEVYPITDDAVAAQRLLAGELDLMVTFGTGAILTLRDGAEAGVTTIENQRADESMMIINTQSAVFSDIRARQALTFATDQDLYVELIGEGVAPAAETMFHPDLIWRNPDIEQETNLATRAGALVAGYCADFAENCSEGRIDMRLSVPGPSVESGRIVDLLAGSWGEFFNVDAAVKPLDEMIVDVALGNFDVAQAYAFGSVDPDNDVIFLECGSISFISLNFSRHCDPERDELIYEQRAIDDLDRRVEIWHRIQETIRDAYMFIFLTHNNWTIGARDNVHNICGQIGPTGDDLFCNSQGRIWLNQIWLS